MKKEAEVGKMTKIEAIIKPFRLTEVQEALIALGIQGMTVSEVKGFGRQKGHVELYRGAQYTVNFVPKLLILTVVPDELVRRGHGGYQGGLSPGRSGMGKSFLSPVTDVMHIRTKETGLGKPFSVLTISREDDFFSQLLWRSGGNDMNKLKLLVALVLVFFP